MKTKEEFELASANMQISAFVSGVLLATALFLWITPTDPDKIYLTVITLFLGMCCGSVTLHFRKKYMKKFK